MTAPTGTITFLFTDIEGSTTLAQQHPAELPALLARHHAILHEAIGATRRPPGHSGRSLWRSPASWVTRMPLPRSSGSSQWWQESEAITASRKACLGRAWRCASGRTPPPGSPSRSRRWGTWPGAGATGRPAREWLQKALAGFRGLEVSTVDTCPCLTGFAALGVSEKRLARGVSLLGAVKAECERTGRNITDIALLVYDETLGAARAQMEPQAFDAAWAAGRALTMDLAMDLASQG
jgi:hypothetical protein